MSLIKKPAETIGKETIAALIYGQSGTGKTTLACSAPRPVVFDFDNGITRIRDEHQVDNVSPQNWAEVNQALDEVAAAGLYKTIIVDTASKMIDFIITDVCGSAQPKLQQWGLINAKFKTFLRSVQSLHMNVIFIAQRETEKMANDEIRYVPQFRASNYKDVVCDLDIVGYLEMATVKGVNTRIVTFDPSPRNEGKNTANFLPSYQIPTLAEGQSNTFLTDRFEEYVKEQQLRQQKKAETLNALSKKIEEYDTALAECSDATSINDVLTNAKSEAALGDLRIRLSKMIDQRAKTLNLTLNKKTKCYE